MSYYEKQGIEAVGAGSITLRRSQDHRNWFRAEDVPSRFTGCTARAPEHTFS